MSDSPRVTPEPVLPGEAGPRLTAAIGRVLVRELPLARRAAYRLRARPTIALAVVVLASIGYFSNLLSREIALRRLRPDTVSAGFRPPQAPTTFLQRWAREYGHGLVYPLVLTPLASFSQPLRQATWVANGWTHLLALPWMPRKSVLPPSWLASGLYLLTGLPAAAVAALILAVLLGWVRDAEDCARMGNPSRYWKEHYLPLLALTVILIAWYAAPPLLAQFPVFPFSWGWTRIEGNLLSEVGAAVMQAFADVVLALLWVGPSVALTLAPFAVVACRLGAKGGIRGGLRLLRGRWITLAAIFVVYRLAYEAVVVWKALAPWPTEPWAVSLGTPAPALWQWAHQVGLALLGLWVAYAFMEIAKSPRRPGATEG